MTRCADNVHRYHYPWGTVTAYGVSALFVDVGDDEPWTCCFVNKVLRRRGDTP